MFNKINLSEWNRKEDFLHYSHDVPCTYSMTVNLDITIFLTQIKAYNTKFFPSILYAISYIVNSHKEFRMDLDENGEIGYYDVSNPCFTVFHEETESFTNIWTEHSNLFSGFIENYNNDMAKYQNDGSNSKPPVGKNIFNVSVIPWISFTGFNLNLQKGYDYFLPIFTIGKYFADDEKILLPLSIQVHHAVC
ncbi:MAG: CatA-like O-acetyltransferase, partial [Brevinema sp.]